MICGMATVTVKRGKEAAVVTAALEHAAALRTQPGCRATYVLLQRDAPVEVSISIFDDQESFDRAVDATRPVIARHHLEQLWERPPSFATFDVR